MKNIENREETAEEYNERVLREFFTPKKTKPAELVAFSRERVEFILKTSQFDPISEEDRDAIIKLKHAYNSNLKVLDLCGEVLKQLDRL